MSDDSTTQCLLFPGIFHKPVLAQFDQREGSSDGGALLLKAADRHYGLVAGLRCCLPVMGFVSFNDEAEQYLCAAVLRPGNVGAAVGAVAMLRRLVRMIRHHLPGVQIRVRLDGGFAHPAVLAFLDAQPRLEYVVAMAKNAVLKRVAETGMRRARQLSRRSGKTEHIYGEVRYKAGKWPGLRRVIIKAEVVRAVDKEPSDNTRFVITNMKQSSQWIYEHVYCQPS